ncbi:hypothetical protein VdG1_01234 [Verticillium dahliae VDG1]|nr:hypothetical protein VdG1_01234 [Verticillium dahliae VDG1]
MSASPRKRSRAEPAEDTKAECPFEVKYESEDVKTKARKAAKRRKQAQQLGGAVGADADEDEIAKVQPSPFTPSGSFKNDENMDLRYWVEPRDKWMAMTRYNSFVLNSAKYFSEGFIYISNGMASPTNNQVKVDENGVRQRMPNEWVGRILEIRAADEHHVYARIYWMYWPEELPVQTKDDGKFVARAGRQPYHGVNELIASNHMDVINVVSVTAEAKVKQWFEENDDEIQDGLYWRQALDVRTLSLSVPKRGKASAARPYEGLFEATLKVAENVVEIRDLRANVTGGVKVWTEPLVCLVCHTTIS